MKTLLFTTFVFIQVFTSNAFCQTIIPPGDVSGTWAFTNFPYHIEGDITIPNDSTLTIEPGVEVIFLGHHTLNVQGRLLAIGTQNDSIVFTVNDTAGFSNPDTSLGSWGGIRFIDTHVQNDTSKFVFCKLQYGKAFDVNQPDNSGGAIFISNFNKVLISNCLITNNSAGGLNSPSGGGLVLAFANIILQENEISFNRAWDGGGIQIWESDPIFHNNRIISNHADAGGGGIWIGGISNPEFNGDTLFNNNAGFNGGGMICWQTTNSTLNAVNISGNSSNWGGGIGAINCEMQLNNCIVNDNSAASLGGGIGSDYSTLYLNNNIFERDSAGFQSGAIHSWYSIITADQCQFRNNIADNGGAIHTDFSDIEIDNCIFSRNSAIDGAGIHAFSTHLKIDSCTFSQNTADNSGAAIEYTADTLEFNIPYQVELTNTYFNLNYATNLVGGVNINQINSDSSLVELLVDNCGFTANSADHVASLRILGNIHNFTVSNSIFSGNNAFRWTAGPHFLSKCHGQVINCLVRSNQAAIGGGSFTGGGAGVAQEAEVDFYNCTFANNSSGFGAGLHVRLGGIANVMNSIFWGNSEQQINMVTTDSRISLLTINNCAIQNGIDSIGVDSLSVLNWGQGNIDADPFFVNQSASDYHLQDISPCIGSGIDSLEISGIWYISPSNDLEGNPRPNPVGSMPDIGAYESPLPDPVGILNSSDPIPKTFSLKQNYPNPFNPTTTVEYYLPKPSHIELILYNISGQEIKILFSDNISNGKHKYILDGSNLASGLYFIQMQAGDFHAIKKILLVK